MSVKNNLENIQAELSSSSAKLLAVSKTFSSEKVREAHSFGQNLFGENYVQEFNNKVSELEDLNIEWHFIGHLQSNKVKAVVNKCELIHTVDREKLVEEIEKRATSPQKVLVEVNLAGEASKSGAKPEEVPALLAKIQQTKNVVFKGLMLMPPLETEAGENRKLFLKLKELGTHWGKSLVQPHECVEYSMGTSQDYKVAIECGATIVRLGTSIFGQRG